MMLRRFACIRQHDETDCAAAALATVARHYGSRFDVQRLRDVCTTDQSGTTLRDLVTAAEHVGFAAKAVQGSWDALSRLPLPAIAHVVRADGLGHFVVLHRVRRGSVVVADPAEGLTRMRREEFLERWSGFLVLLVPDPHGPWEARSTGEPATSTSAFVSLLRPHGVLLSEAFVSSVVMTLLAITSAVGIQVLVDSALLRGDRGLVKAVAIGLGGFVLFQTLFNLIRQALLIHVSRRVDLRVLSAYARHLLRLPMQFFESRPVGDVVSRLSDTSKIRDAVSGTTLTILVDGLLVLLTVSAMFAYNARLASLTAIFLPLLFVSALAHHRPNRVRSRKAMESAARLQSHVVEDFSCAASIKALGVEGHRNERARERIADYAQAIYAQDAVTVSMNTIAFLVPGCAGVLILGVGGLLVVDGALTIGQLMFFYAMLGYAIPPLQRLASVDLQLQEALVAMDRIRQIIDLAPEQVDGARRHRFEGIDRGLEMKGVSLTGKNGVDIVRNVDVKIPAGTTTAIVGSSGSGKTTLLNLLVGFQVPTAGRVTLDGVDVRDADLDSLRGVVTVVPQESHVFAETLRYNLTLHRPQTTQLEIEAVIDAVCLREFVDGLPNRYESRLGDGALRLSGGERQRLALARALLSAPDVLLLDEATSHLDALTERSVVRGLHERMRGKTIVVVAHRLATVKHADSIVVMRDGAVVEEGVHDELLRKNELYATLWRLQAPAERTATRTG